MHFRHISNANHKKLDARIQQAQRQIATSSVENDRILKEIRFRLSGVNRRISEGASLADKIAQVISVRYDWLKDLGQDLKDLMYKNLMVSFATLNCVLEIKRAVLINPFTNEAMVYFEDALGRWCPIPLQMITCWDDFNDILKMRFREQLGLRKVMRGEYVLQYRGSGKEIDTTQRCESVFRPGLCIDMSMVFVEADTGGEGTDTDACPNPTCKAKSNQPLGVEVIWYSHHP